METPAPTPAPPANGNRKTADILHPVDEASVADDAAALADEVRPWTRRPHAPRRVSLTGRS